MLISVATYQSITGDTTSATAVVETAVKDAQGLLEDRLRRPLELASRTERLRRFPDGRVYPSATPITSGPAGSTVYGAALADAAPAGSFLQPADEYVDVTYTGGFDPTEDDRSAVTFVPVDLARAVAWAARAIVSGVSASSPPAGARSVTVGDVSVAYGPDGAPSAGEIVFDAGLVSRYRRRRDGAR